MDDVEVRQCFFNGPVEEGGQAFLALCSGGVVSNTFLFLLSFPHLMIYMCFIQNCRFVINPFKSLTSKALQIQFSGPCKQV
jgi:hypothetical protein